ncbi:hypothetical protein SynPROSU1_02064 [Synechococcus sp. PROS-U-1]|nr:hypothetical protein SynPROSU1_02064 [Synechococcus sp. PROS-U-1]
MGIETSSPLKLTTKQRLTLESWKASFGTRAWPAHLYSCYVF